MSNEAPKGLGMYEGGKNALKAFTFVFALVTIFPAAVVSRAISGRITEMTSWEGHGGAGHGGGHGGH